MDDLPVVNYGINDSVYQKELFHKIVKTFKTNNVPAIGFVNEKKLFRNNQLINYQVELLNYWVDNGLELGNHTFSHPDYNKVNYSVYIADLQKGDIIMRQLLASTGKSIKYFRPGYLHLGNTKEKADSLSDYLKDHHYTMAPVTVDNEDYWFAVAYKRAMQKQDSVLMIKIGSEYIAYMERKIKYFENQSKKLFGKNIRQILIVHASHLNADYLNELIAMCRRNNYSFVSMDKTLEDPLYKTPVTVFGEWGISWLDQWALSAGKNADFFKQDPLTPDFIMDMVK